MSEASLVTVATFTKGWEAHLARLRLEQAGTPAFVVDEHAAEFGPAPAFVVRVLTPADREEEARALLEQGRRE